MGERLVQGLVKGVPVARIDQVLANLTWAKQVIDRHAAKAESRRRPEAAEQAARQLEVALRTGFERVQLEQMLGDDALTLEQIAGLAGTAGNLHSWGVEPKYAVRDFGGSPAQDMPPTQQDMGSSGSGLGGWGH